MKPISINTLSRLTLLALTAIRITPVTSIPTITPATTCLARSNPYLNPSSQSTRLYPLIDNGDIEQIEESIKLGAKITTEELWGLNALQYSITTKNIEAVKAIIKHNPDIMHLTNSHSNAADIALSEGSYDILKLLIKSGFKMDTKCNHGPNILHSAITIMVGQELIRQIQNDQDIPTYSQKPILSDETFKFIIKKSLEYDSKTYDEATSNIIDLIRTTSKTRKIIAESLENYRKLSISEEINKQTYDQRRAHLHQSILEKNVPQIKKVLSLGVDITKEDEKGFSSLLYAVIYGDAEILNHLLDHIPANTAKDCIQKALAKAVTLNKNDAIKPLLEKGADANGRDSELKNITILSSAIMKKNIGAIKILLENGASADLETKEVGSPLEIALQGNSPEIVKILLDNNPKITPSISYNAIKSLNPEIIQIISDRLGGYHNLAMEIPKVIAHDAKRGIKGSVADLIILLSAAAACSIAIYLISDYYRRVTRLSTGKNPINPSQQMRQAITKFATEPNIGIGAVTRLAEKLSKEHGSEPLSINLNTLIRFVDDPNTINLFLRLGANPNIKSDIINDTPLHFCIMHNNPETIQILVDSGAALEAKDSNGRTPLNYAISLNAPDSARKLKELGASSQSKDVKGESVLGFAICTSNDIEMIKIIAVGADLEIRNNQGQTALHQAAANNKYLFVEELKNLGSNLEAQDNIGQTPLHYSAANGAKEAMEKLIELGANIEAKNNKGESVLDLAMQPVEFGDYETLDYTLLCYSKKPEATFDHSKRLLTEEISMSLKEYLEQNKEKEGFETLIERIEENKPKISPRLAAAKTAEERLQQQV